MTEQTLLIGDIGGTNARFALANDGAPGFHAAKTLQCADYESVESAVRHYLDGVGAASVPAVICLAAAGPVIGKVIDVTNNHWHIDATKLASSLGTRSVRLVNDFEAVAYSIPFLEEADHVAVGIGAGFRMAADDFDIAIVGPGTGLGAAGLLRRDGRLIPVAGEGGHIGFAPESSRQRDVLAVLAQTFERVSVERLLSGSGIENTYDALCSLHGGGQPGLPAADIFGRADADAVARETVDVFFTVLGQVCGDLAMLFDARDGVFIAGGICKRYPELLQRSRFRAAFENKGHHRPLLESIPTRLITHAEPGLLGAAYVAMSLSS